MFLIGRVRGFPVAREGAQKLKEISYLHAEAYPASELKHGPLALVCPELPTIAVVPDDDLLDKNLSTLREIQARKGRVLAIAHREIDARLAQDVIRIPKNEPALDPILLTIPLPILAYPAPLEPSHARDTPPTLPPTAPPD